MADFRTHVSTSSALGVAYGAGGLANGLPPESCVLAAGLCALGGMLPDLDSRSGRPVREMLALTAAVAPMFLIDRFRAYGLTTETTILAGAGVYVAIRFGVGELFKRYTTHRGMWHSLPAAAIAGLLVFLAFADTGLLPRLYKAASVVVGFLSHLVLDEMYSIDLRGLRIKKSFGTAIKFWSDSAWANFSTYGKLAALLYFTVGDPVWEPRQPPPQIAPAPQFTPPQTAEWPAGAWPDGATPDAWRR